MKTRLLKGVFSDFLNKDTERRAAVRVTIFSPIFVEISME